MSRVVERPGGGTCQGRGREEDEDEEEGLDAMDTSSEVDGWIPWKASLRVVQLERREAC